MKPLLTSLLVLYIAGACFAQNAKKQKNEPVKKNEAATLQKTNVTPIEKTKAGYTDQELINLRNQGVIPGVNDGIYKYEAPIDKVPVDKEKTETKETEKIIIPK